MYTKPGSGLTQESPVNEAVLHDMVSGHRLYAEARRHAELQATVMSDEGKQEIQRRRAEAAKRNRAVASAESRTSSAKREVQDALDRRRAASESLQPDAESIDASAVVTPPAPPTAPQSYRGTTTASTKETVSSLPQAINQATATLGSEERQAIQRRRAASSDRRRVITSEDTRASATQSELQAVFERRRAASDCDAAEVRAVEDCGRGARTPTQVSEQCTHELEDNCHVASTSLQPTLHTGGADTAGMHSHLGHDAIVKDGFVKVPCKALDTHSAQQPHDSFKIAQVISSTSTQRAAAAAAAAAVAADVAETTKPPMTVSPFAEVPVTVESGTACKQKQKQRHQPQQHTHQPKCCCTIS